MDKIHFERIIVRNHAAWICAKTFINDMPLFELVCDYEKSHISFEHDYKTEYEYECAGAIYTSVTDSLLKKVKSEICLLVCTCMVEGCKSFTADIYESEPYIIFDNFRNWRLQEIKSYNDIDYSQFGTFTFDKKQFYGELENLKTFSPLDNYRIAWDSTEE
jgi:hypothetical protein